jgi:hypothetical protein
MTADEAIDHVMTVGRVIALPTVRERCDALIIIGHEQHGLPFFRSHGESQLAEFFRPMSENASFVRTHSRSRWSLAKQFEATLSSADRGAV